MHIYTLLILSGLLLPTLSAFAALPNDLQETLQAAKNSENTFVLTATVSALKQQHPNLIQDIDMYLANLAAPATATMQEPVIEAATPATSWVPTWAQAWKGKVIANAALESGNTDTQDYELEIDAKRDWLNWALRVNASAEHGRDAGVRDEEAYAFGLQGDYKLSSHDYIFAAIEHDIDNFDAIVQETEETVGYGRTLFQNETMELEAQIGLGAQQTEDSTGATKNAFLLKPEAHYTWDITQHLAFEQGLEATLTSDLSELTSVTALENDLTDNLSLRASYTVEHATSVPIGTKKTDTTAKLGLVYGF